MYKFKVTAEQEIDLELLKKNLRSKPEFVNNAICTLGQYEYTLVRYLALKGIEEIIDSGAHEPEEETCPGLTMTEFSDESAAGYTMTSF